MTRRIIVTATAGIAAALVLFAAPTAPTPEAVAETISPLREFDAELVEVAINAEGG